MEKNGQITELRRQVPIEIAPGVQIKGAKRRSPPIRYFADFSYVKNGEAVIEDVKGVLTPIYKIKRHLLALQGIHITEVSS